MRLYIFLYRSLLILLIDLQKLLLMILVVRILSFPASLPLAWWPSIRVATHYLPLSPGLPSVLHLPSPLLSSLA